MLKSFRKCQNSIINGRELIQMTKYSTHTNKFEDDFRENHITTNFLQRSVLTIGSAAASILDPHRADMIACLSETTGKVHKYCTIVFLSKMEPHR